MKIDKELEKEYLDAELENKHDRAVNILRKNQFAEEIKLGLGQKIKENTNKVTIIKIPLYRKIMYFFRTLLTKF